VNNQKIFIAGHQGLVGSSILRELKQQGYKNILTISKKELDLTQQSEVFSFLKHHQPDYIINAAAKVGGILANNTLRGEFIYQNLMIQTNLIHGAWLAGIKDLLFINSNCSYPRECAQPMKEDYLLTGPLEPTNEPYAIAKIAGVKMCESYNRQYQTRYISMTPCSLYGPNDNFDPQNSHVVAGLIRKFHEAKINHQDEVVMWGTGTPRRELMYVDDAAKAAIFLMNSIFEDINLINVGVGYDYAIKELGEQVAEVVGYKGRVVFDTSKPDGMPRKLLDHQKIHALGWTPQVGLREGLEKTYAYFLSTYASEHAVCHE
jgi:GDP-L-fucose synthase